ncbi:MAG: dihydrolipoyl dehydrogenase [Deltaproteobacteria bacterium]|nr:dihydrolipoyl dehydrogenase [Deltaproteobacteria bacterium]
MSYDLIVVGAGPGGYVAAIRARQYGAERVAVVEKGHAGGTCLNVGCIPSKALIASATRLEAVRHAATFGVQGVDPAALGINVAALMERKNKIVTMLRGGVEQLLKGHGVELIRGTASIPAAGQVVVNGDTLAAKNIIIATGSTWRTLPGLPIDGTTVVVSDHMLEWQHVPARLLIIGGGIIGCEFASMMQSFGAAVTLVEATESLLPGEDLVIGRTLARSFAKRGITVHTGTTVEQLETTNGAAATLANGTRVEADRVLVSVGRKPYTEGLGAEALGLLNERGFIPVDAGMQTTVPGIYAIGDVVGGMMLAHVASAEAEVAVKNCLGGHVTMDYHAVPRPVFTTPEVCAVGETEKGLQAAGVRYKTGRFTYAAVGKALCAGETDGAAQVYTDENGVLLGGHVIGAEATDLGQQLCLAIQQRLSVEDVAHTIFSHPTLSEVVKEAVEDAAGFAVHKVGPKRP